MTTTTEEISPPMQARGGAPTTFWFTLLLTIALVAAKASHPDSSYETPPQDGQQRLIMLAAIVHQDLIFAAAVGLIGQLLLWASRRRPRVRRAVWAVMLLVGAISVGFAVASVPMFHFLGTPLTYPLLHVAGNMANMGSSLASFARGGLLVAIVFAPLAFVGAVLLLERFVPPTRRGLVVATIVGMIIVTAGDFLWTRRQKDFWSVRDDRGLTRNPHWAFINSCLSELAGGDVLRVDADRAPSEYAEDFKTIQQRGGAAAITPRGPRNAILIVLESVSTQHLGLYGSKYDTTPRRCAEAKHSLIVRNCYSHVGMTANSLVSILLGVYPPITWRQLTVENPNLPGESIPQQLAAHGYRTAYITSADNGYVNTKDFLEARGFEGVWDVNTLNAPYLFTWGCEDRYAFDATLRWIDAEPAGRPFFITLWTQQTHHPYPQREDVEPIDFFKGGPLPEDDYDLGNYLNAIREADTQIGRLIDGLRERKLADDTLIIITGDHGEGFGSPHEVYGHGSRVYEENLHVPMVLWNPRMFTGGQTSDAVGGLVDVGATICDVIGVPAAPSWQGRSLLDPNHPPRTFFSAANDGYLLAVRQDHWKYIFNATRGREELFDLSADPAEQKNVARDHLELSRELRQRLGAWLASQRQRYAALQK